MKTEDICDAYALAATMHRTQVDKVGKPYLYHCHIVAMAVRNLGPEFEIVGVLHDVVEDTECSLEEIRTCFGEAVYEGVKAITKLGSEDYFSEYLARVEANPIARAVKLEDAKHNFARASQIEDEVRQNEFREKYLKVIKRLEFASATTR